MLRFLRSRLPHQQEAKKFERDEYFDFQQTLHHGFPTKACCMAYDDSLNLLAVGTKHGQIRIYGAPGVEFSGQQPEAKPIKRVVFVPNQGRVITQCEDQSFHLWEINSLASGDESVMELVTSVATDDRLKTISALTVMPSGDRLLIGTESGNVYTLDVQTLTLSDYIVYQDVIAASVADEFKATAGAVECFSLNDNQLLIGFTRALIVLWDCATNALVHTYATKQSVESVSWHGRSASKFVTSHNDGSYAEWSADDASKPAKSPNIPFGPFPCKPIDKITWRTTSRTSDENLLIFTGGMPRASFGDRHTVAVHSQDKQVVFDLSSKVQEILVIDANIDSNFNDPHTLIILCEEELVAIDLLHDSWPMFRLPYMWPLHASPITACQYVNDVPNEVMDELLIAGSQATVAKSKFSTREWPIQGGKLAKPLPDVPTQLMITGHEDGSVRMWTADSVCMRLVHTVSAARLFDDYQDPHDAAQQDEDDWPPFRRVGHYDPFSDDPRYGVQRVLMDAASGTLLIGCNAGQVIVASMTHGQQSVSCVPVVSVNVVTDQDNFTWKGESALQIRADSFVFDGCFAPDLMVQMHPPAAITALAIKPQWNILSVGTAHGFSVINIKTKVAVYTQCLLNADDMAAHNNSTFEATMTRFKSFKKSLRDSFRRRRRHAANTAAAAAGDDNLGATASPARSHPSVQASPKSTPAKSSRLDDVDDDVKPVERQIESRSEQPEGLTSLVRCLLFADTYVTSATETCRSLWVGTNGGAVRIYIVSDAKANAPQTPPAADTTTVSATVDTAVPESAVEGETEASADAEDAPVEAPATPVPIVSHDDELHVQLAKEIQLQHGAPVLAVHVLDEHNQCVRHQPQQPSNHRVLIVSEEQLKAFTLPALKAARHKYKLTATEGSRIRKNQIVTLPSKSDNTKSEHFLLVMSNQGELNAFELRDLRRYMKQTCLDAGDVHGILSTIFNESGEGLSLTARGSEWQRFAVSTLTGVRAQCTLILPEGVRMSSTCKKENKQADSNEAAEHDTTTDTTNTVAATSADDTNKAQAPTSTPAASSTAAPVTANSTTGSNAELNDSSTSAANTSAMPTDITVDSIRDYTNNTDNTSSQCVVKAESMSSGDDGQVVRITSTTTTTATTFNTTEQGDCVVVEETANLVKNELIDGGKDDVQNGHDESESEVRNGDTTNGHVEQTNGNGTADHEQQDNRDSQDQPDEDEIAKLKGELKEKMVVSEHAQIVTEQS